MDVLSHPDDRDPFIGPSQIVSGGRQAKTTRVRGPPFHSRSGFPIRGRGPRTKFRPWTMGISKARNNPRRRRRSPCSANRDLWSFPSGTTTVWPIQILARGVIAKRGDPDSGISELSLFKDITALAHVVQEDEGRLSRTPSPTLNELKLADDDNVAIKKPCRPRTGRRPGPSAKRPGAPGMSTSLITKTGWKPAARRARTLGKSIPRPGRGRRKPPEGGDSARRPKQVSPGRGN